MKIELGLKQRIQITSTDYSPFQENGYVMKKAYICKSCGNAHKAGKNALGLHDPLTGACCTSYDAKNRVHRLSIHNMVLERIDKKEELPRDSWQGLD